jgi:hypothetical protein
MRIISCVIVAMALMVAFAAADGNFKKVAGSNMVGIGSNIQSQKMTPVVGANLENLQLVSQEKQFKTVVGTNFEELQMGSQNQGGNFGTVLGANLQGLQILPQSGVSKPLINGTEGMNFSHTQSGFSKPSINGTQGMDFSESTMMVYVGQSSIPLNMYQTTFGNYLWIEGTQAWSQYASIPQYSSIPLVAYTPTGGQGEILEMYPRGSTQGVYKGIYYDFNPGYNRLMYRGDVAGRHYLLFAVNDQPSNSIIIDVTGGSVLGSAPVLGTAPTSAMP